MPNIKWNATPTLRGIAGSRGTRRYPQRFLAETPAGLEQNSQRFRAETSAELRRCLGQKTTLVAPLRLTRLRQPQRQMRPLPRENPPASDPSSSCTSGPEEEEAGPLLPPGGST